MMLRALRISAVGWVRSPGCSKSSPCSGLVPTCHTTRTIRLQTESKPQPRLLFHVKVIPAFVYGWLLSISNAQAAEVKRGMSVNSGRASPKSGDLWSPSRSQVFPFLLIFAGFSSWETTKHRIARLLICSQLSSPLTFRYASRPRGSAVSFLTGQCN